MDSKLFANDNAGLNKNQKKKRRRKRAQFYKRTLAAAVETAADGAPAMPRPQEGPGGKRRKTDAAAGACEAPVEDAAAGVLTAEPLQRGAQLSIASVQLRTFVHPAAQQPAGGVWPAPAWAVVRGVCRLDLSRASLLIAHHIAGDAHASPAAEPAASAARRPPPECTASVDRRWAAAAADAAAADGSEGSWAAGSGGDATPPGLGGGGTGPAAAPIAVGGRGGGRVYIHGNYHRYYGYRLGQAFSEDPRLGLLERQWFAGRRCLDVGCNEGLVTLGIAARFGVRSMVGVDIDEHLIRRACTNLREERSAAAQRAAAAREAGVSATERAAARRAVAALAQTWFVHGDFLAGEAAEGSLDTITALSVTKWVHLHAGDAGLRAFFEKVRALLAPGGFFVVEPQPWRSYKAAAAKVRRQGVPPAALPPACYFHRLEALRLRPEALPDVLCDELGFRLVKRMQPPDAAAAGFDRQLYLFRKPA